jgi:hypothetical protein
MESNFTRSDTPLRQAVRVHGAPDGIGEGVTKGRAAIFNHNNEQNRKGNFHAQYAAGASLAQPIPRREPWIYE